MPSHIAAHIASIRPWGPVPPPPGAWTWEGLMAEAMAAIEEGQGGEVPVGAVIVAPDGSIIARASNAMIATSDPTAHAEVRAIRMAAERLGNYRLTGCVLVVTLEPCLMCAAAAAHARLAGIVYGAGDQRAGAVQSAIEALDLPVWNHRVWHYGGVCSGQCAAILNRFFAAKR